MSRIRSILQHGIAGAAKFLQAALAVLRHHLDRILATAETSAAG
ncbi:hypothetical protein [Streptomyces sp. V4I23]|nr:hypothetical protein [Streptomyces sp. V4I23]